MTTNAEASGTANIVVRDIDGSAQMRAVEELQKQVWGIPDLDVVPLSHLVAAKAAGVERLVFRGQVADPSAEPERLPVVDVVAAGGA